MTGVPDHQQAPTVAHGRGVDRSQIRELLRLSARERLDLLRADAAGLDRLDRAAADVADLIRMKQAAARPKDLIEVEVLSALRDEIVGGP